MGPIDYTIVRTSRRKTVSIVIQQNGSVEVRVPSFLGDAEVERIARGRSDWIHKKISELNRSGYQPPEHNYLNGEKFPLLGELYSLAVSHGRSKVSICEKQICVTVPMGYAGESRQLHIQKLLFNFFTAEAVKILREKSKKIGKLHNLNPVYVSVKEYRSRWGCCFGDGRIFYNWKIILAPEQIVDYVVVHELCHLREPNHSKNYWKLVESIIPDWKTRRSWLKCNGHTLEI